jgi:hypothetical protein
MVLTKGAAVLQTYGFAAEFKRDIDGRATVWIHTQQIQMQDMGCENIPLHFANDGFVNGAVEFNIDDGRAVSDEFLDHFFADRDGFARLTEPVQICRNPSGTANQPGTFGPRNRTTLDL